MSGSLSGLARRALLTVVAGALAAQPAAADPKPQRVALTGISGGEGFTKKQLETLEELLLGALERTGRFKLFGRSDLQSLLAQEQQKQLLGCDQESCLAEIGGALGADLVGTASLSHLGRTVVVSLKLINMKAEVVARVQRTVAGDDQVPAAFDDVAAQAAAALFGAPPPEPKAEVQWTRRDAPPPEAPAKTGRVWPLRLGIGAGVLLAAGAGLGYASRQARAGDIVGLNADGVSRHSLTQAQAQKAYTLGWAATGCLAGAGALAAGTGLAFWLEPSGEAAGAALGGEF